MKDIRMTMRICVLPSMLAAALLAAPACVADGAIQPTEPAAAATEPVAEPATASADPCQPAPATEPASTTQPTTDPAAMQILLALERAGEKYHTIRADLEMVVLLPQLGDSERRTGWVAYQRRTDEAGEKIRVHFETLALGEGPNTRQREDYAFDGQWAVEAKHSVKQITRWQVAAEGERVDALRIGKGSFPPLPFGQKAAEVLEYYEASTRPPAEGDPSGCDYVKLLARREERRDLHFVTLEMWVDRETGLPVKIMGADKDRNTKTVALTNVKTDETLPGDVFELKGGFGWTTSIRRLPPPDQAEQR